MYSYKHYVKHNHEPKPIKGMGISFGYDHKIYSQKSELQNVNN